MNSFLAAEARNVSEFQSPGCPRLAKVDGKVWPSTFKPDNIRSGKEYIARDDDILICTFPKCGTTWAQFICLQLLSKEVPRVGRELSIISPMLEAHGRGFVERLDPPRLIKTHYEYDECPKSDKAKYIYVARNPKDCLVSWYHQHRNMKCYNWPDGSFDVFFDLFLGGRGDYWGHLLGWMPHFSDENVLLIKYEDMIRDLTDAVKKIGEFLGGDAAAMVHDPGANGRNVDFLRKGTTRDWMNHMTKEQSDLIDKRHRAKVAGTEAESWWREEMAYPEV